MPIPVQSPGPAEQLEDRYAFKGGMRMFVDETIVPVEVIRPRARKFVMGTANVAAGGAGLRSEVAVHNPNPFNQGIIDSAIWVHAIWISSEATEHYELFRPTTGFAGFTDLATKTFLDFPLGITPSGQILSDNTAAATAGTVFWRHRIPVNTALEIPLYRSPIILDTTAPSLLIRVASDNVHFEVSALWSEPPDPA